MKNLLHVNDSSDTLRNKWSKNPTVNSTVTRARRLRVFGLS